MKTKTLSENKLNHSQVLNPIIFKAYDIRGIYETELTLEGAVYIISEFVNKKKIKSLVLAHDFRNGSENIYKNTILLIQNKIKIFKVGLATTPMLYYLTGHLEADAGIMITASHSPKEYNGLKIVGRDSYPISGEEIKSLFFKNE